MSDLPTSSPAVYNQMTKDQTTITALESNAKESTSKKNGKNTEDGRSKSIVSDESSDLSDLDSEAETERMYDGESQLEKIAKNEDQDETLNNEEENDDTVVKTDYTDQLDEDKDCDIEIDANEEIGKVVEQLKQSEEPEKEERDESNLAVEEAEKEESPVDDKENGKVEDIKKRKLSSSSVEPIKKRKTEGEEGETLASSDEKDIHEPIDSQEQSAQYEDTNDLKIDEENSEQPIGDKKATAEDENANEAEDEDVGVEEDEEEDDEDEEEQLTEEQKATKQKELEIELEHQKQRKEAVQFLTEIEIDFAKLRDRLYEDKMARFKSELEMCLNGSHPELQNVYSKIDSHREEKIRLASQSQKYKFECIDRKTRAQRTSIHQQYFKRISDFKSGYLKEITKEWYKINKERRLMDSLVPDFSYRIPNYTEDLVTQRAQVNEEISVLVGLKEYYGFPRAPELKAIEGEELDNDLKAMNIL